MIFLNKSATTNVILTLSELTTLTGSTYYLFNFISDDNQSSMFFTAPDISSNTERYNEFSITEGPAVTQNLTAGTIHLETPGYYQYKIYQMTGQTNIDLSGATLSNANSDGYIESGKVLLSGSSLYNITTQYTGATSLNISGEIISHGLILD